ncbi:hypothetical protein [Agilicoccus flavus]|uniref:hypothetical protein n=1 Tax=Agilicoccus flavus TaxID=2775968 RepID=UPI001CF662D7|nr:hypothetical protein [Agilicoccus flavus]
MTASIPTRAPTRHEEVPLSTALEAGAAAAVAAAVVNVLISALARAMLGIGEEFVPLTPGPIVLWTTIGAVVGALGWRRVVTHSARAGALLRVLVPTVLVLSFAPDLALLVDDSTPGQTTAGVVILMVLHVVTATVVVLTLRWTMPYRC